MGPTTGRCEIHRCRGHVELLYIGHGICSRHWDELMSEDAPPDALRMALGIGEAHEIQEDPIMSKKAKKETTTETKAEAKPERKAARRPEPKEKVELRTLALRVTEEEFRRVHEAAGPRNLTAFMRTAVLNAAQKSLSK